MNAQSLQKQLRQNELTKWAQQQLEKHNRQPGSGFQLVAASDDASFRRYFRGSDAAAGFVFVDAPPQFENNPAFIDIARRLEVAGLNVPRVFEADLNEGYLMLSDLGDGLLLDVLAKADEVEQSLIYQSAFAALQQIAQTDHTGLPAYDEVKLRAEMALFPDWFLAKQINLAGDFQLILGDVFDRLVTSALEQPVIFVHRDFHSRNLMPREQGGPAVIDFQDAVSGPVTYDLVSVLKDCYWRLPRSTVVGWVEINRVQLAPDVATETFLRWFDLMGMQRHIKCAGIFSRLNLRDGKPGYLKDIPLVLDYILEVTDLYPEDFGEFGDWMRREVLPRMGMGPVT